MTEPVKESDDYYSSATMDHRMLMPLMHLLFVFSNSPTEPLLAPKATILAMLQGQPRHRTAALLARIVARGKAKDWQRFTPVSLSVHSQRYACAITFARVRMTWASRQA